MSMFKAKLNYDNFIDRARNYQIPFKFYVKGSEKISMFMQHVIGSATIMFLYWCEVVGDEKVRAKVETELKNEGFKQVLAFDLPRP